jgi:hypothetical protein
MLLEQAILSAAFGDITFFATHYLLPTAILYVATEKRTRGVGDATGDATNSSISAPSGRTIVRCCGRRPRMAQLDPARRLQPAVPLRSPAKTKKGLLVAEQTLMGGNGRVAVRRRPELPSAQSP